MPINNFCTHSTNLGVDQHAHFIYKHNISK